MQKLGLADMQLANMQGTEYCLLHVQEPILYVIRKQLRHSPSQVTPVADYYVIAGTIYQAPDIGSVINSRVLSAVTHLHQAFEEARGYSRYHPSRGYWWDFGSKEGEEEEKGKEKKEKVEQPEPSSLFQRRRVDMLLDQLTRQFPFKTGGPGPGHPAGLEAEAGGQPQQAEAGQGQAQPAAEAGGGETGSQSGQQQPAVKRERVEPGEQQPGGKKIKHS